MSELLVDRAAVTDVLLAYCDLVDRAEVDELVAIFTKGASFDYGNGAVFAGKEQLRALFADRLGRYRATNHHLSNIRVTLSGDAASAVSYVYAWHESAADGGQLHIWGRYIDTLVRVDGTWLLDTRQVRVAGAATAAAFPLPERFERYARRDLS
ncbi:nuclear transport factor 2 family protein [Acrocarpospora catenulata]|uniref:nuclear transport factor 2 family protein n=1 Tax=Acrocarpospora catenulata TaxID=2836182 RepID=UPI001BDB35D4|nr:nuclear transport factor 2 family protein [Acrocarpospora catenulata]